ncbi:Protein IMPACT [Cytospora mali]|uniref:Protein IMPACT n=1 Tax=Cytospora mali TaxID=578113 RepID=A0A194W9R2_CYTMA|nr:Protein IMPACT [Valsa mali]
MATQQDLQELLRLQTARRMPIKDAMAQIKALQAIVDAPLDTIESALKDPKAARSLQNACKAHLKRTQTSPATSTGKRPAAPAAQEQAKRARYSSNDGFMVGPTEMTPQQLESSLSLPIETDPERIAETAVHTNRAPLVLAFAVELLRYTMPEQPPSSRLSLAQAVVSANSRSKAVSIGLDKGPSADEEGWAEGQPRIKVMGREIAVLKRGGYEWKGEEEERMEEEARAEDGPGEGSTASTTTLKAEESTQGTTVVPAPSNAWSTSPSVTLKQSTFIARATTITEPSQRPSLLKALFAAHPNLETASHNVWAYRIHAHKSAISHHPREASHDDGETGAGDLLLRVMRETNSVDTLVVMTRWYGGIMLGPDRWRLMRNVVTSALSERLRRTGVEATLGGEAVWGLDLEAMRSSKSRVSATVGGMMIHRPEAARSYLLKSFASAPTTEGDANATASSAKKKTVKAQDAGKEENLGMLLGALRLLFDSWADFLTPEELDRRAWSWYSAARPEVEYGPAGWGAKGVLRLKTILDLRRKDG